MRNKIMAVKREVRNSYLALLKSESKIVQVKDLIRFYDEYDEFRNKLLSNPAAPSSLKVQLPPIRVPQYVEWMKRYLGK